MPGRWWVVLHKIEMIGYRQDAATPISTKPGE
jgi:hypothetical protein